MCTRYNNNVQSPDSTPKSETREKIFQVPGLRYAAAVVQAVQSNERAVTDGSLPIKEMPVPIKVCSPNSSNAELNAAKTNHYWSVRVIGVPALQDFYTEFSHDTLASCDTSGRLAHSATPVALAWLQQHPIVVLVLSACL